MAHNYISTRGGQRPIGFCRAVVQGIADDGGLLVPDFDFPQMDISALANLEYAALAAEIIGAFAPADTRPELESACRKAYASGLFPAETVPVKKAGDVYVAELFHGPTAAFKDMALSLLPHLMTASLKQTNENREVLVLTATSGDTGKAALEGFRDVEGTRIKVFYPVDGVSPVQKQQMVTQEGRNVEVVGINGNFDDAQNAVKQAFGSAKLKSLCDANNILLTSANSINTGRLLPQACYFFYAYFSLLASGEIAAGEPVNFCIPSGNFGNALAGYFAKRMGLPIGRLICASNKNCILTNFFTSGRYDANREFYKTLSPAMDILISSNLERLVYFAGGNDPQKVDRYMRSLREKGVYEVEPETRRAIARDFAAEMLSEAEMMGTLRKCYESCGYLLDTHTAVGFGALEKYRAKTGDRTKTVLLATASPYKFPESVWEALSNETVGSYRAIESLHRTTGVKIPPPLRGIDKRPAIHTTVIDRNRIADYIRNQLENRKETRI